MVPKSRVASAPEGQAAGGSPPSGWKARAPDAVGLESRSALDPLIRRFVQIPNMYFQIYLFGLKKSSESTGCRVVSTCALWAPSTEASSTKPNPPQGARKPAVYWRGGGGGMEHMHIYNSDLSSPTTTRAPTGRGSRPRCPVGRAGRGSCPCRPVTRPTAARPRPSPSSRSAGVPPGAIACCGGSMLSTGCRHGIDTRRWAGARRRTSPRRLRPTVGRLAPLLLARIGDWRGACQPAHTAAPSRAQLVHPHSTND